MHNRSNITLLSLLFAACLLIASPIQAAYEIRGQVHLSGDWQRQVFLSTINKLDDYYAADPDDIIQIGHINEDGTFAVSGNNLPPEPRFYRLYLVKEENSEFDACLYVGGDDHNFVHLILDNNSLVEITTDASHHAPFGQYEIKGDPTNAEMGLLSSLVYPSFYFHKIKFPSELQFSEEKLNRDLFQFADSSRNALVALAAIINTDMDKYHEREAPRYAALDERLQNQFPQHNYTQDFERKLHYYQGKLPDATTSTAWYLLVGALFFALVLALAKIYQLQQRIITLSQAKTSPPSRIALTPQEEKILGLIVAEKTNKEIAATLFVEVSTVKTHINKLYAKLEVKNRREAKARAKDLA